MKRLIGLLVVLALCLPMVAAGQSIQYKSSGVSTSSTGGSFFAGGVSLGNTSASPYANLFGDAANTLALRNGVNAQTLNVYNTFTDSSNYERLDISANGTYYQIQPQGAGTGSTRTLLIYGMSFQSNIFWPSVNDGGSVGLASKGFQAGYFTRSIQGSKTKALTEAAATAVTQIAVPQTAGANFADATIEWAVYASDGTDSQVRKGSTYLAAVNKAGTETCTVGDVGTTQVAVSAGTLTCTTSCITGLTDVVQFALNCTSSLAQTSLNALARLDMMQPNTVTPQ